MLTMYMIFLSRPEVGNPLGIAISTPLKGYLTEASYKIRVLELCSWPQ